MENNKKITLYEEIEKLEGIIKLLEGLLKELKKI